MTLIGHIRYFLILTALATINFCFLAGVANASTTTYLRPDQTLSPGSWTTVGAATAWEALDDPVSPSETPSGGDYATTSNNSRLDIGFSDAPLAGATSVSVSAWFYTSTSAWLRVEVRNPKADLVKKLDTSGIGWHSIQLDVPPTQWELDSTYLRFERIKETPQVEAALLRVTQTPSAPKLYWGAWISGQVYGRTGEDAPWVWPGVWEEFEKHSGKPVSIVHFGQPAPWNQNFAPKPLEETSARGAIPLMDMDADGVTLASLNSGAQDAALTKWAEAVATYKKPFFFRWQWEMNLPSTQLGSEAKANPELFKSVWRRFHQITEKAGAANITWVWCPNVSFTGSTPLASLYPGNAYVDWTCMDGYNHGTKTPEWTMWNSFSKVFSTTYSELTGSTFEGREKPIMIGETATTESGGSKPEWIAEGLGTTLSHSFPKIKAMVWFNWNIVESGTEWDWQIESSTAAESSFANVISSPYYAGNSFENLMPLTRIQPLP